MKFLASITFVLFILAITAIVGCKKKCDDTGRRKWLLASNMKVSPQATEIALGDTLTLTVEIPYDNIDLTNNNSVNIANSSISEFTLGLAILNKTTTNSLLIEGREQFKLLPIDGVSLPFTEGAYRNTFRAYPDRFLFKAYVIPLKKGLVDIGNYKAEASLNDGCIVIDLRPACINNPNNYDLYHQFITSVIGTTGYSPTVNKYNIWVK